MNHQSSCWRLYTRVLLLLFTLSAVVQACSSEAPKSQKSQMDATNLTALSNEYKALRSVKGHFEGGPEFVKDVDGFNGKKHKTLDALCSSLGVPNTPLSSVVENMGIPDEVQPATQSLDQPAAASLMPGPVLSGAPITSFEEGKPFYAIYHWRGRHDYVWFLFTASGVVEQSGWYNAGE
ncbi:hypothetical protein BJ741DRAFT_606666 [Chytriomyces cf. hyalinus JEL632]|nr:hypothetical protein BJ741DRAFT_606666 [Chytriomyces cf. hyalinus JEL632]